MWLQGKVIGILNVDSTQNISETKFNEWDIIRNLDDYADSLAKICAIFVDGIRIEYHE